MSSVADVVAPANAEGTKATILKWCKSVGESVIKDEPLIETRDRQGYPGDRGARHRAPGGNHQAIRSGGHAGRCAGAHQLGGCYRSGRCARSRRSAWSRRPGEHRRRVAREQPSIAEPLRAASIDAARVGTADDQRQRAQWSNHGAGRGPACGKSRVGRNFGARPARRQDAESIPGREPLGGRSCPRRADGWRECESVRRTRDGRDACAAHGRSVGASPNTWRAVCSRRRMSRRCSRSTSRVSWRIGSGMGANSKPVVPG